MAISIISNFVLFNSAIYINPYNLKLIANEVDYAM